LDIHKLLISIAEDMPIPIDPSHPHRKLLSLLKTCSKFIHISFTNGTPRLHEEVALLPTSDIETQAEMILAVRALWFLYQPDVVQKICAILQGKVAALWTRF